MADVVERVMALWRQLPEDDDEARAGFAEVYAENVVVNGTEVTLDDLLARARGLQAALSEVRHELLERVEADDKIVVAFRLHGRHTGPLRTALGEVPATGREVAIQGIDVLTLTDGRITGVTVLADELGLLDRLGAVSLR